MAMSKKYNLGMAKIENATENPMDIFNTWKTEAKQFVGANSINSFAVATVSKDNYVTNRYLYCFEDFKNRFVFNITKQSPKYADMKHHPQVCGIFLWDFKDNKKAISKQIKIEGDVIELERSVTEGLFKKAPLYVQVRSIVCSQGQVIDWDKVNTAVEDRIQEVKEKGSELNCPTYEVTMELIPKKIEFSYSFDDYFADRIVYTKGSDNKWTQQRLAA